MQRIPTFRRSMDYQALDDGPTINLGPGVAQASGPIFGGRNGWNVQAEASQNTNRQDANVSLPIIGGGQLDLRVNSVRDMMRQIQRLERQRKVNPAIIDFRGYRGGDLTRDPDGKPANLAYVRMNGFNLAHVRLPQRLMGAKMRGANLYNASAPGAMAQGIQLQGASLRGSHWEGAHMENADLSGATGDIHMQGAHARGLVAHSANLAGSDFSGAEMIGARIYHSDLRGSDLAATDLRGAHLEHSNFSHTHAPGVVLSGATILHSDFSGADLHGIHTDGAHSEHTSFRDALVDKGFLHQVHHLEGFDNHHHLHHTESERPEVTLTQEEKLQQQGASQIRETMAHETAAVDGHGNRKQPGTLKDAYERWALALEPGSYSFDASAA